MTSSRKIIYYLLFIAAVLPACKIDKFKPAQGNADFSRYIAIGDSQTAGYSNDGLYNDGIAASFPADMAMQMKAAGGGDFVQPLFNADQKNGSGYLQLTGYSTTGSPITARVTNNLAVRGTVSVPNYGSVTLFTKYTGSNNNLGITGIKLADLNNIRLGNNNAYFERLLPGSSPNNTTSYSDYITAQKYTFFSCWLGNNDVLGYATAGAAADSVTGKDYFKSVYSTLIDKLTAGGQKGVVATIPDVSALPFFNTVTVDSINRAVKALNPSVPGIYINARSNSDPFSLRVVRLATNDDKIVLTFDVSQIGKPVTTITGNPPYGLTPASPIDNKYVLDKNEIIQVRDYITSYNTSIKAIASSKGLGIFDAYAYLNNLKAGLVINGIKVNTTFITGGVFSLDGIHLTPRGYALLANQFDAVLNSTYGSSLTPLDISKYPAISK